MDALQAAPHAVLSVTAAADLAGAAALRTVAGEPDSSGSSHAGCVLLLRDPTFAIARPQNLVQAPSWAVSNEVRRLPPLTSLPLLWLYWWAAAAWQPPSKTRCS